jgi:hypothetical protein
MSHLRSVISLVAISCILVVACREEAKAPPPEPAQCARFAKHSDDIVETVLCAGTDTDGDGIDDAVDLCPDRPETKNGVFDGDGCPDPDRDDDGLADYEDGCPDEAGPPPDGCPSGDKDGDGIPDHLDACPNQPEDLDGEEDSDGCPEGENRALAPLVPVVEARIAMQRGRATPTPQGARDLARLVDETARDVNAVVRVRIVGRAGLNEARRGRAKPLADERASHVRDALKRAGVPASRLATDLEPLRGGNANETGDVLVTVLATAMSMPDAGTSPDAGSSSGETPSGESPSGASSGRENRRDPIDTERGTSSEQPTVDDDDWDRDAIGP